MKNILLQKLSNSENKNENNKNESPYVLNMQPLKISIIEFANNNITAKLSLRISKTYRYLDENWVTVIWRNPDGTIGNPPKKVFTQDLILHFVKFYDWRIDKIEFLEESKKTIYETELN